MAYDIFAVCSAYFLALWMRFDFIYSNIPEEYLTSYLKFIPYYALFALIVFWRLRLYNSIWRFASFREFLLIMKSSFITMIFHTAAITMFVYRMPISYYMIGAMVQFGMIVGIRFSYRFVLLERKRLLKDKDETKRVMVIGAGAAGRVIIQELLNAKEIKEKPYCIIDDNSNKWGRYIEGVPVVGGREDILLNVEKYRISQILFAIPSASAAQKRDILNICKETGCELKSLPGVYQLVNGEVSMGQIKKVAVEDLLGREPIQVNLDEIFSYIKGKRILVTGGGGSIGSELARQIASRDPQHLILFDIYENNLYDIEQELKRTYPDLNLSALVGSVRDTGRINWVFETYKPDIVYHAAAHKHVPLMEASPWEAIKNNAIGTYKTAYAALKNDCKRFVLISTDKAVNPTNIMGASKRMCEMVIQGMDVISKTGKYGMLPIPGVHGNAGQEQQQTFGHTEFVAVRFGNVLGSNGSVIPLFKKQIESGGPVTVTHPDIIRYFMTIPEAVSLVLQAGVYANGGEIFILDMGEPVKIDTLARNLIKLSGFKPDVDIKIAYTGLRPGEKLYEEKLMKEEGMKTTPNQLIHIGSPIAFDVEQFFGQMKYLAGHCYTGDDRVRELVGEIVPTYQWKQD